jgi:hypothetical protein
MALRIGRAIFWVAVALAAIVLLKLAHSVYLMISVGDEDEWPIVVLAGWAAAVILLIGAAGRVALTFGIP